MSNKARAERRARCWANGQKRKEARKAADLERQRKNKQLRAEGKPTPWEEQKARRAARPLKKKELVSA
jgi:hypothetical protein